MKWRVHRLSQSPPSDSCWLNVPGVRNVQIRQRNRWRGCKSWRGKRMVSVGGRDCEQERWRKECREKLGSRDTSIQWGHGPCPEIARCHGQWSPSHWGAGHRDENVDSRRRGRIRPRKTEVPKDYGSSREGGSEKAMAPHSSTLAWKIPWTEESGRLQSVGSLGVGHNWETSLSLSGIGEGKCNPLQYSCLENPRDGGAWWAAVYGVAQSRTQLKQLSSSSRWDRMPWS